MSTTTEQHNPSRPPFAVGTRVYWQQRHASGIGNNVAVGMTVDPARLTGARPDHTTPVMYGGAICHVPTHKLRAVGRPTAPVA